MDLLVYFSEAYSRGSCTGLPSPHLEKPPKSFTLAFVLWFQKAIKERRMGALFLTRPYIRRVSFLILRASWNTSTPSTGCITSLKKISHLMARSGYLLLFPSLALRRKFYLKSMLGVIVIAFGHLNAEFSIISSSICSQ